MINKQYHRLQNSFCIRITAIIILNKGYRPYLKLAQVRSCSALSKQDSILPSLTHTFLSSSLREKDSKKKPRESSKTRGSIITTPSMFVFITFMFLCFKNGQAHVMNLSYESHEPVRITILYNYLLLHSRSFHQQPQPLLVLKKGLQTTPKSSPIFGKDLNSGSCVPAVASGRAERAETAKPSCILVSRDTR